MPSDAVASRVTEIRAQLAMLRTGPAAAATAAPATTRAAGTAATSAASGATFARALDGAVAASQPVVRPTVGSVSSEYGPRWGTMHKGIDFAAPMGAPVRAAVGGTVKSAGWNGGYGNVVEIDHGNGTTTLYAHNSAMNVQPGQRVQAGDVIAKIGSTGHSTGPHLHFEVKVNGEQVDPRPWLTQRGVTL
jgi:murein DD-endopeptidase MepM/ murein hydrolase activator NlpD